MVLSNVFLFHFKFIFSFRWIFIAFLIFWPEYTDADISHLEVFLMLVFIRVSSAHVMETGSATENDGINNYIPPFSNFL